MRISAPDADSLFMATLMQLKFKISSERGASMVEYALLLATIAVVVILSLTALGEGLSANFSETTSLIAN